MVRRKLEPKKSNVKWREADSYGIVGHITASIGIAAWSADSITIEKTLSLADQALYEAKGQGRNRCIIATPEMAS
ncbi:diguanylate cyclase domain-containing protein [Marinomonas primoryensis]|uniref:GGDEF domain-containing protein n=1 Tax=Marinomonas primoryensis TaxID=178399 RepID=UPI0015943E44